MAGVSQDAPTSAEPGADPHAPRGTNLVINEIYASIQGESSYLGMPCVFVRLTACNLRCTWCDTTYSFHEGLSIGVDDVIARVVSYECPVVEITGGEPLLQQIGRAHV